MSERHFWQKVRKGLSPFLRMQRIEDRFSKGIPDLLFAGPKHTNDKVGRFGLIELKYLRAWPKRKETIVWLPEWKPEQKAWFQLFGEIAHDVFLLLQAEKSYFLYTWDNAIKVGKLNTIETMRLATAWWDNKIDFQELADHLLLFCKDEHENRG